MNRSRVRSDRSSTAFHITIPGWSTSEASPRTAQRGWLSWENGQRPALGQARAGTCGHDRQTAATRCAKVRSSVMTGHATPKWLVRQRVCRCGAGDFTLRCRETCLKCEDNGDRRSLGFSWSRQTNSLLVEVRLGSTWLVRCVLDRPSDVRQRRGRDHLVANAVWMASRGVRTCLADCGGKVLAGCVSEPASAGVGAATRPTGRVKRTGRNARS